MSYRSLRQGVTKRKVSGLDDDERAAKRKVSGPDDDEGVTRIKQAHLNDDLSLSEAIERNDFLAVKQFLECKVQRVSKTCLEAALLQAAEEGNKPIVQLLVRHGVYVKGRSKVGCLALIAAAKRGYLDIVKLLIRKGVPVDSKDSSGRTALMAAVEKSCCSVLITFLLENCEADINLQDNEGKTALMLAVEQWDYGAVQILFFGNDEEDIKDYNCDEGIKDKYGRTALDLAGMNGSAELMNVLSESRKESCSPLKIAARRNNLDLVQRIVETHPFCIDSFSFEEDPLTSAMYGSEEDKKTWDGKIHCSFELVDFLVREGVNVSDYHFCGYTPLMFAAAAGADKVVELLLNHKAVVNDTCESYDDYLDWKRQTPLMMAAHKGWARIVKMLIRAGAKLDMKDNDGENALGFAARGGHRECVKALLKRWKLLSDNDIEVVAQHKMLDVLTDIEDRWNDLFKDADRLQKLLWYCVNAKNYDAVETLIKCGADVNRANESGDTILMKAVQKCDPKFLELIIRSGADVNAQTDNGDTALLQALHIRKKSSYVEEKVALLLQHGANVNHINLAMKTPLMVAAALSFGYNNVFKMLLDSQPDLNARDANGDTATHFALCGEERLEMLATKGADINIVNGQNKNPLMIAFRQLNDRAVKILINQGASINKHRSQVVRQAWRNELDFFLRLFTEKGYSYLHYYEFKKCVQTLFEAGFTLHDASPSELDKFLVTCINIKEFKLLALLVESGVGPSSLDVSHLPMYFERNVIIDAAVICNHKVTPMCMAILLQQPQTVAFFAQTCFYHQEDVKILRHPLIKEKLNKLSLKRPTSNLFTLDDLCPEKWSLRTWSKLAVLRAVGYGEGREQRLRALPIPNKLQDELLYKNVSSMEKMKSSYFGPYFSPW
ncbi:ankyrin repeat protein [Elysia marginata]|uniref:Ankyrin repeat protein n=1 Tax=Elysia marginata TaxID=1093978 RepID=A0AAV4IXZ2_9GAST|nr:ankyrin repeat protein [Elysia marginata]